MTTTTAPTADLLFGPDDSTPFSIDEKTIKDWARAEALIRSTPKAWLSTIRPDGRPHSQPILVAWADGVPCFTSRPGSVKGRNLARDGRSTITASGEDLDLVIEGHAERASSEADLTLVAAALREKYGWEFALRDGRVYEPSLSDEPEYTFFLVRPVRAYGYGADGLTATRWVF